MDPQRALSNPLRMKLVRALESGQASPRQLAQRLEEDLPRITYHMSILAKAHCVRVAETERRRGVVESFYELTPLATLDQAQPHADAGDGESVPTPFLREFMGRGITALETGTPGPREGSRLSCIPVNLDERGWGQVKEAMDEAEDRIAAACRDSAERLSKDEEEGVAGTIAIASVKMPKRSGPPGDRE